MVKPDNTAAAGDAGSHQLWFAPPVIDQDRRRTLTRERLVAEALAVIAADRVDALSMRALAEAFLAPLYAGGLPARETGLAFSLLYDYTLGFALSGPTSINEQRLRDAETRSRLHTFLRSLPSDRFPALVALGAHVWVDNRDERFTAGLDTLIDGLQAQRRRRQRNHQPKR